MNTTPSASYASTRAFRSTRSPFPVVVAYLIPTRLRRAEHTPPSSSQV
eukprot:CAMPEP_0182538024 /NCGR_PEP_ID=MMETSP1323-20130603/23017_1 /TAXON_ID=236787 /ORGANISM="Florenciella parvula, Strain RCC1693" /LENGTH=47 /DNA_ID= /DNA_START= /DNA_END= /DNA_ORIENTATION=